MQKLVKRKSVIQLNPPQTFAYSSQLLSCTTEAALPIFA